MPLKTLASVLLHEAESSICDQTDVPLPACHQLITLNRHFNHKGIRDFYSQSSNPSYCLLLPLSFHFLMLQSLISLAAFVIGRYKNNTIIIITVTIHIRIVIRKKCIFFFNFIINSCYLYNL